jgi:hypothetical protein
MRIVHRWFPRDVDDYDRQLVPCAGRTRRSLAVVWGSEMRFGVSCGSYAARQAPWRRSTSGSSWQRTATRMARGTPTSTRPPSGTPTSLRTRCGARSNSESSSRRRGPQRRTDGLPRRTRGFGLSAMAPWPMMQLAIALNEHGDAETAQAAAQKAADSGHPPVAAAAKAPRVRAKGGDLRSRDGAGQKIVRFRGRSSRHSCG